MATLEELLFETLEDLGDKELKTFKFHLHLPDMGDGFPPIKTCHLDNADRLDVASVMVQKYNQQAVEVTKKVLKKMSRNDLVLDLSNRSKGLNGNLHKYTKIYERALCC